MLKRQTSSTARIRNYDLRTVSRRPNDLTTEDSRWPTGYVEHSRPWTLRGQPVTWSIHGRARCVANWLRGVFMAVHAAWLTGYVEHSWPCMLRVGIGIAITGDDYSKNVILSFLIGTSWANVSSLNLSPSNLSTIKGPPIKSSECPLALILSDFNGR